MAEAKVYLQIEPVWSHNWTIRNIKVTKVLQSRPEVISGVLVEMRIRIPDSAFKPPAVTIDIPEEALILEPEVTVEFPGEAPHVQ